MSTYSPITNVLADSGLFNFSTVYSSTQNIAYTSNSYEMTSLPNFVRGVNIAPTLLSAHNDIGMEYNIIKQGTKRFYVVWANTNRLDMYVEFNNTVYSIGNFTNAWAYLNNLGLQGAYVATVKTSDHPEYAQICIFIIIEGIFAAVASTRTNTRVPEFLNALDKTNIYDPYGTEDNHTPPGGYAGFDYEGDDVDIPSLPSISAANSGFVRLYNPTITEVQDLSDYLWAGAFDIATYKKLFGNPMDCFLSFGIIPITPSRSDTKENISFANMPDPGVTAYKITDQFAELDCGSVTIDGSKYTSSAMDYSPYTRAEIFLPFCGTHSLSVDEIMDATVGVVYHMDLYTGACVAYVKITKTNSDGSTLDSVLYQFTGNILATIPLTGADHSSFIQSILFMGAAAAATVATAGGAAPEIGGAMAVGDSVSTSALGGAAISASGINAVMSMKPNVMRSGNLSANAGFLGLKKPVITLTLPNLCRPENENELTGMPCQKSGTLSSFTGFNIVGACHLDNIPCTMEELRMIDEALAKGVII